MRNKPLKIILTVLFASLIFFGVALYVYEVAVNKLPPLENIYKLLVLVVCGLLGLMKLYLPRRSVLASDVYLECAYANELKGAFETNPEARKKLVRATGLYNEKKFNSAISALTLLEDECESQNDRYPVYLFKALALTDSGDKRAAQLVYEKMIREELSSPVVYGNLGTLYVGFGMESEAVKTLKLAIESDPDNPIPRNNLATLSFDLGNLADAKTYALSAIEVAPRFKSSATLLALIYSIEDDKENEDLYTGIAISSGESPSALKRAKAYYKKQTVEESEDRDETKIEN